MAEKSFFGCEKGLNFRKIRKKAPAKISTIGKEVPIIHLLTNSNTNRPSKTQK
jgi:hypothetical protein